MTVLRTDVPPQSIFCNHCTANSYCFCLYKEKNFLEWHSPAEYLQLNPCKINLDSRIFLPDSLLKGVIIQVMQVVLEIRPKISHSKARGQVFVTVGEQVERGAGIVLHVHVLYI